GRDAPARSASRMQPNRDGAMPSAAHYFLIKAQHRSHSACLYISCNNIMLRTIGEMSYVLCCHFGYDQDIVFAVTTVPRHALRGFVE
ncbi:hypothetical protein, partial [Klebsiella pneumoniae]